MEKRFLRELEVSSIGYGCMGLSHGYGPIPEENESIRLIRKAYEEGCTFFDTAEGYGQGHNESLVGQALKPIRQEVVVATKFRVPTEAKTTVFEEIESRLDKSLKRLQMDTVDLYYWHRLNPDIQIEDVSHAMQRLIDKGKIRTWGLSQCSEEELRLANSVTPVTAVQSEYSLMERMFEKDVVPACKALNIGFVPFSPLASAFLSAKYSKEEQYTGDDVRRVITRFQDENIERNQALLDLLHRIANDLGATTAQVSLAWILKNENFIVPIPGMRRDERIIENFGASKVKISDEAFRAIEDELKLIDIHGNRTDQDIAKLREID